ncbi:MAG: glycosyl hydrolase family 28 protein [Opitutus sp.]
MNFRSTFFVSFVAALFFTASLSSNAFAATVNVRDHGARGDGITLDSPAINAAIEVAEQSGGGTVLLPAGRYLSFSIRLQSNLTLQFEAGAVLVAAEPSAAPGHYDAAEPNQHTQYQDFGHSHWRNSLIWGIDLENVSIIGPGLIDGTKGLTRFGPPGRRDGPATTSPSADAPASPPNPPGGAFSRDMTGLGNKAIALKNCRNVTLRDVSILNGGHFALLATGVDQLTLDNLKIDTNRDGFDIDACRNVHISNCTVNAPHDDAIVLKSSFALGTARATENVTITNCAVSGYDIGSVLNGTYLRTMERAPDRDGPTGRIKFGTESNGGFRNIVIANCTFERSRGLALETVDGGDIEDVVITGITMREVTNSPIFIRLGHRARGPAGTPAGHLRRIKISHVTVHDADGRFPILLAGLPDHPIEDVTLTDIDVVSRGGISMEQVAQQPAGLVNAFFLRGTEPGITGPRDAWDVPERAAAYPEPSMFGLLPAAGLYARHVARLSLRDIAVSFTQPDARPFAVLDDIDGVTFENVNPTTSHAPRLVLDRVHHFETHRSFDLPDIQLETVDHRTL